MIPSALLKILHPTGGRIDTATVPTLFSPRSGTYEDGKITVCGADNIIEFGLSYGEEEIMLRTGRTTYYYYYYAPLCSKYFFKHSHNFLWVLPSWKSLAPVHKMIGKITRKNIINICSSYRPCPVRSNIEKSTSGKVYKPIGDRLAHPRYFPAVPWASGRPSCPVSDPTLS